MKILILSNEFSDRGGADIAAARQADIFYENGWDVTLFTYINKKPKHKTRYDILSVKESGKLGSINVLGFIYSFRSRNSIRKLLSNKNFDVAIVHLVKGGLTVSVLRELKKAKIAIVRVLHDYELLDPHNRLLNGKNEVSLRSALFSFYAVIDKHNRNSFVLSLASWLDFIISRALFSNTKYDRVVHVSDFSRNLHLKFLPELAGITLRNVTPTEPVILNVKKKFDIIYFGRLSKEKGITTLIEAFSGLNSVSLSIAGDVRGDWIHMKCKNIRWLGFMNNHELLKCLPKYKFAILPSEWYENNPLSIIEAFSFGIPCIGADIGGIPEMIIHGKTGYLFKSGDVDDLRRVVQYANSLDEQSYLVMQNNCIKAAKQDYGKKIYIDKWSNLLKGCYEGK